MASTQIDPDNATILVCGGGGVALHVTRKLKDMGSWVYMMQRTDTRRSEVEKMMAFVVKGDALNKDDVNKVFDAMDECDAVVCSIGGTLADPRADSEGNINIIEAAAARGVKKFVLITSVGCGDSKDAPSPQTYQVLQPVLVQKDKAEQRLMELKDKMVYTIVRPGGLVSEPATGNAVLTESNKACGAITREDVATLAIKALLSPKADNKVLTALDMNRLNPPSTFDVFQL